MSKAVVYRGGLIPTPGRDPVAADVAVVEGRFDAVAALGTLPGDHVVDLDGQLMLPGAIDMHVHFRQPGFEYKEDFGTGTAAAACGGVTTICDMPNTMPPVIDVDRFVAKRDLVAGSAHVDFGLWAGGTRLDQYPAMKREGAVGVKVYMNRSHRPDDPYATELSMPDDVTLGAVLETCAALGLLVAVHVSDHEQEARSRAELSRRSLSDARLVCRSYRSSGVLDALRAVVDLARQTGARVHIAHASLAPIDAIDLIDEARRAEVAITCECGPPALLEDELDRLGVYGVPFAFPPDEAGIYWRAIADGRIDLIATDHAPHTVSDKEQGRDDVWAAPPGYPGVETSVPLMLDAALRGVLPLSRVVEAVSTNPARVTGLTSKGNIAPGYDADFILVDSEGHTVIDEARLHSKAGWSPFHGRTLRGRITATYLRGTRIASDQTLVDTAPIGRQLHPEHATH